MKRRYRVERVRSDHGYGLGWVTLDDQGEVVWFAYGWEFALFGACTLARRDAAIP